jgi:hypothetical protein
MTTTIRSSFILVAAVLFLTGYNFLGAAWTPAPAKPPASNTDAPITVSDTTQTKEGRLNLYLNGTTTPVSTTMLRTNGNIWAGNLSIAGAQMRSPLYCDEVGTNCFSPESVFSPIAITCPTGQAVRSISANGTPTCGPTTVYTPLAITCPTGQAVRSISANGTPTCGTVSGGTTSGGGGGYYTTTGCGSCPSGCHLINIGGSCSSNNSKYLCGCN